MALHSSKVQRNKKCVNTLTSQMMDFQKCLKQQLEKLTQHQKLRTEQETSWVNGVKSAAEQMKDDQMKHLDMIDSIVTERFSDVLSHVETLGTSLEQISALLETQRVEQEERLRSWSLKISQGLEQLEETVRMHTTSQAEKITQLQQNVESMKEQYMARHNTIQEKLSEIMRLQEEERTTMAEMGSLTVSQTRELRDETDSLCNRVGEKRKHTESENQSSLQGFLQIHEKHCKYSQVQIHKIKESSAQIHSNGISIQGEISHSSKETRTVTENYNQRCGGSCDQHFTELNTELNTHFQNVDNVQSALQNQCDHLVDTLDKHSAALEKEVDTEKSLLSTQLQGMTGFTEQQLQQLNQHKADMERYIKQELSECVPTGATPQRREFQIRRNIKRTSDHGTLLERFHVDNMVEIEEEAVDSDAEQENQVPVVVVTPEDEGSVADDKSDAGSVKSSTSGISGMSGVSDASKMSEYKENDRQGRPLGLTKGKKNFDNVTPRAKTRLPLKQSNAQ